MDLSQAYVVWRLLAAAALGAIVGLERETRKKPAGLRTNMLVAVGAAAFTVVTVGVAQDSGTSDPTRIVQGVATGIGFLGAGSIMRWRSQVTGLTTAAGIWVVGAVGVACGLGEYTIAVAASLIAALILAVVDKLEPKITGDSE